MWEQIFSNPDFSKTQIIFYFLGAFGWFASYILVVRKIIKDKWVEFPAFVIAGNVAWEFLWGFVFDLSFGGIFLQYVWRGGFLLDAFMLYSVYKYGKKQYKMEFIRKNYVFLVTGVFIAMMTMLYLYVMHGYDIAMGFNSGMILNIIHSVGCVLLFMDHPDRKFSFWIGITRFLGTNVFFFAYLLYYREVQYFSISMIVISIVIDSYYLYEVVRRNKKFALAEKK
jgi:hypothetical protein